MNFGTAVDDAARFFRGGQGVHTLSEEAVTGILAARRGIAPNAELVAELGKQGAIFSGGVDEVLKNAPKGEGLLDAIRGRVGEELFSLVNAWKDRNFPVRLERALSKQEELLPKLRAALVEQKSAFRAGNDTIQGLHTQVTRVSGEAEAAVKAGNDDLASRLLSQKLDLQKQLEDVTTRTAKYQADVANTENQITTLLSKIEIDKTKSQLLLSEWKLGRQLEDLAGDAKSALDDLNKLESDALKNARRADQATKEASNAVDDLLNGGGIRVPGSTPPAPGAPTVPVGGDKVAEELKKLKDQLGKA